MILAQQLDRELRRRSAIGHEFAKALAARRHSVSARAEC